MVAETPVIILAGGFGTRLRSVLSDRPKPMAEIEGKPFLYYLMDWVSSQGYTHFILLTHFMSEQIKEYFGTGEELGWEIEYCIETKPLGTGGAVLNAINELNIDRPFLLLNGDSFIDVDLKAFEHQASQSKLGIITRNVDNVERYGSLEVDESSNLVSFKEKMASIGPGQINAGVYFLNPQDLSSFEIKNTSIEQEIFPKIITQGKKVKVFDTNGYFIDIGTPESFYQFIDYIKERRSL